MDVFYCILQKDSEILNLKIIVEELENQKNELKKENKNVKVSFSFFF